jgi:hypothetical protein
VLWRVEHEVGVKDLYWVAMVETKVDLMVVMKDE